MNRDDLKEYFRQLAKNTNKEILDDAQGENILKETFQRRYSQEDERIIQRPNEAQLTAASVAAREVLSAYGYDIDDLNAQRSYPHDIRSKITHMLLAMNIPVNDYIKLK